MDSHELWLISAFQMYKNGPNPFAYIYSKKSLQRKQINT